MYMHDKYTHITNTLIISYCLSSGVNQFKTWYVPIIFHHSCHDRNPLSTVAELVKLVSCFFTPITI